MKTSDLTVELRLSPKAESKVKAFADVTIPLGSDGVMKILGFSVLQVDSEPPRVIPPARKGRSHFFETIFLIGPIRHIVDEAVSAEYMRLTAANR